MPGIKILEKESSQEGFSLIELMVVMGIISILFGLIIFNLFRFQSTSSQQSSVDMLISDIKSQQFKSMTGYSEDGVDSNSYGIYFYPDSYVLFHGVVFDPAESSNFTVELPDDLNIASTTFPGNTIIFEKISGELIGHSPGADSVTVKAITINRDIVITLNRYGVITGIVK
jgi:prepilin-type N-terminal cleavage/methylation domain-containing protein